MAVSIFLAAVSNACQGVVYSGSADPHGVEGTEAGAGGSWCSMCSQEAGSEERWLSSLSPFHSSQTPSATYIRGRNELIQSKQFLSDTPKGLSPR